MPPPPQPPQKYFDRGAKRVKLVLDPQPLVVPPPQPLVVPALWKVEKMHTEDPERGKFHREDWMQHQPAGHYYCSYAWDNPPSPGSSSIFRKGDQPGDYDFVVMYDQSIRPRIADGYGVGWTGNDSILLQHDNAHEGFRRYVEQGLPGVYSNATQEQIEFYKNVKRAFREATRLDPDVADGDFWACNHVDGHEAAHLATILYRNTALELYEDMGFNDGETPVFYSCRGDSRTRHIFDMEERDYIAASPAALEYAKDPLHADFYDRFQAADDLYRLATIPEKAWLLRCRAAGKMVE